MKITLEPAFQNFIEEQVRAGRYALPEDVVQAGLRLLREQEPSLERIREQIAVGLAQAKRGELLDGDAVFEEILASLNDDD